MLTGEAQRIPQPCCGQPAKPHYCCSIQARFRAISSSADPCLEGQCRKKRHSGHIYLPTKAPLGLCSAAGLFKSMALGTLARRATHLPGLLSELRPHLKRLLVGQSEALQAATMALLEALLPKEPDSETGVQHARLLCMRGMGADEDAAGHIAAVALPQASAPPKHKSRWRHFILLTLRRMWLLGAGWVLDILLGTVDFTRCPSKTVRGSLFGILRDAWQLRPSLQVSTHNTPGSAVSFHN